MPQMFRLSFTFLNEISFFPSQLKVLFCILCCVLCDYLNVSTGPLGRRSVSALIPGSSGPGLSLGRGHCVVFLGITLHAHGVPLGCINEYRQI